MNQTVNDIQNSIYQAVEIIAQNAITQAGYDKTITAYIEGNEQNGVYNVRYQDAIFSASTDNLNTHYPQGTAVYVLVPGGDFSKTKKIIGTVQKLGKTYISQQAEQNPFYIIGSNCIEQKQIGEAYCLSSFEASIAENKRVSIKLYDIYNEGDSPIKIDQDALKEYMKNSQDIQFSADFKNLFADSVQKSYGDYGLIFEVEVVDPEDKKTKVFKKICKLTTDNMDGNPYIMTDYHNYTCSYNIGFGCEKILSIEFFAENFQTPEYNIPDIYVTNLKAYAMIAGVNEINDLTLTISSPKGLELSKKKSKNEIELIANLAYKGNLITNNNIETYWFMEDASVTTESRDYNPYGGQGWCCLNDYTLISDEKKHWYPNTTMTYIVNNTPLSQEDLKQYKRKSNTRNTRYKCVCYYQDKAISTSVIVINEDADYNITMDSSQGELFKTDIGTTTIKCNIEALKDKIIDYNKIIYQWGEIDSEGVYTPITLEENAIMNELLVLIKDISFKKLIVCNIYQAESQTDEMVLLGTGSTELTKIIAVDSDQNYILSTVNNNGYVFKYDANGRSPASLKNVAPLKLLPLSFKMFTQGGVEIVNDLHTRWLVPVKDTMLNSPLIITQTSEDSEEQITPIENGYYVIEDKTNFTFSINEYFENSYKNNSILLEVMYQGYVYKASFDFNFIKDGEMGTNGTDFYCEIKPNIDLDYDGYPILFFYADTIKQADSGRPYDLAKNYWVNFNWNQIQKKETINNTKWFSATLYKQGVALDNEEIEWSWSILKNPLDNLTYNSLSIDTDGTCHFQPGELDADTNYYRFNYMHSHLNPDNKRPNLLNIQVEAIYNGHRYYNVFPVAYAWLKNFDYIFKIEDGCNSVMYSSDKTNPQYSYTPFKISKKAKNTTEWEILETLEHKDATVFGSDFSFDFKNNLFKPNDFYNGEIGYNQIRFIISGVAEVYFPLHFYLNRYGHAAINGWDGNSISLNEEDIILAPQFGAGKKDADNSFTGVLMGTVKHCGENVEETGLFTYSKGTRSFFLDADNGTASFGDGAIFIDPNPEEGKSMLTIGGWNVTDQSLYKGSEYLGTEGSNLYLGEDGFSLGNQLIFDKKEGSLYISGDAVELTNTSINISQLGEWQISPKGRFLADHNGTTVILQPPSEETVFSVEDLKITRDGNLYLNGDSALFVNGTNIIDMIPNNSIAQLRQQINQLSNKVTALEKENETLSDELVAIKDRLQHLEDANDNTIY